MPPKNGPRKLLIIPLDQEFLVQHVFALCKWDSFYSVFFTHLWSCQTLQDEFRVSDLHLRDTSFQTTQLYSICARWAIVMEQKLRFELVFGGSAVLKTKYKHVQCTLYNVILRIPRIFLKTREIIKISIHPCCPRNFDWFSWW